jgi:hydrogenase maturation protease
VRVLVAGIGNIFLSDDGFGSEVARELAREPMPEGVEVTDFGIRGIHLAYQLLDGYDALVLVDAVSRGEKPGTISLIEPDILADVDGEVPASASVDAHGMDPESVLRSLAGLGGTVGRVLVVGCEPASLVEGMGLSDAVQAAVPLAVQAVKDAVSELISAPTATSSVMRYT